MVLITPGLSLLPGPLSGEGYETYVGVLTHVGLPSGSVLKNLPANTGGVCPIPGLGRSPAVGNGNPLQRSCLENPMDRGAWQATVHRVAKSWTRLRD